MKYNLAVLSAYAACILATAGLIYIVESVT